MLIATEYCGSVGVGVTSPQYFYADNGKRYVVKMQNNQLGLKVLVNEYIGARLGAAMELRFPPSDIIAVNEKLINANPDLVKQGTVPGLHFASQYLENAEYINRYNIPTAANLAEMAGIILFDHLLHNPDRTNNPKNLLLQHEGNQSIIYAIDNSHLARSGRWTLASLRRLAVKRSTYCRSYFGILLKEHLFAHDFIPYIQKVKALSSEQIETIISEIPIQWLPDAAERNELACYIKKRCSMVEEIWSTLCKYIPQARGGCRLIFFRRPELVMQKSCFNESAY